MDSETRTSSALPADVLERLAKLRTSGVFSSEISQVLFDAEKEIRTGREKIETYQGVIMRKVMLAAEAPGEPSGEEIRAIARDFIVPAIKAVWQIDRPAGDVNLAFLTCSACTTPSLCRGVPVCKRAAEAGPESP